MSVMTIICVTGFALAGVVTEGPVEQVGEGYTFTEGPVWRGADLGWAFSDVQKDTVYQRAESGDVSVIRNPSLASNGLALDADGNLLCAEGGGKRIVRLLPDGSVEVLAEGYDGKPFNAPNDLCVRSDGTIFFTDPKPLRGESAQDVSGVYSIAPDGTVTRLASDFKYPNGIALSPDESTLYVADTSNTQIRAFDLTNEGVANGRKFCTVSIPDGIAVDAAGNVWSSTTGGISVFSPDGELLEKIKVPRMPTNCAIGGADGKTLFITARTHIFTVRTKTSAKSTQK